MNELLSWMVEYNWMALALWALAFAVGFFGVLLPLIGFGQRMLWNFIDECSSTPNMFYQWAYKQKTQAVLDAEYAKKCKEAKVDITAWSKIYRINQTTAGFCVVHIKSDKTLDMADNKFWTSDYPSSYVATREEAEGRAATYPSKGLYGEAILNPISRPKVKSDGDYIFEHLCILASSVLGLIVLGALLNFLMYPTLLIGSIVATVYGMRSLRRVQKKTVEILTDLKAHRSQSAEEAHPPKDAT